MTYPKEFYYTETSSRLRYTSKPGRVECKRILEGRADCFITNNDSSEQKQKKLIFADWTARNWNTSLIDAVISCLNALMKEGFSIYLWQSGEVKPLTRENLDCLQRADVRQLMIPEYPEQIIKAAVTQQKLTHDSTFVLDSYWLKRALLHNHDIDPLYSLELSDFVSLQKEEQERVLDMLKKIKPELGTRYDNELSTKAQIDKEMISTVFQPAALNKITTLKLDGPSANSWQELHYPDLFKLNKLVITKEYENAATEDDLQRLLNILSSQTTLENINLSDCKKIRFANLPLKNLEKLRNVDLSNTIITTSDWYAIQTATHLESLNLTNCTNTAASGFFLAKEGSLLKLKSVMLDRCYISKENVKELLLSAPNIEHLNLSDQWNIAGAFSDLPIISLTKLKTISLCRAHVKIKDLKTLLLSAPNLEVIDLTGCDSAIKLFSSLLPKSLIKLKNVISNNCYLTAEDINALLLAAPNLEYLDSRCIYPGAFSFLLPGSLSKLKRISSLGYSAVTAADLKALFLAAPNLEYVDFPINQEFAGSCTALSPGSMQKLKEIKLNDLSNFPVEDAKALFLAAPNIEELEFCRNENIANTFSFLKPGSFKKLKIATLMRTNISPADVSALLSAAPNLDTLNLRENKNIASALSCLKPGNLDKLKKAELAENITEKDVEALCLAAPNLEEIYLYNCTNIAGAFSSLNSGTLNALKKVNLIYAEITAKDLMTLYFAAPNLEELFLRGCKNLAGALSKLVIRGAETNKLKRALLNKTKITEFDLTNLLICSPNLEEIDLSDCKKIAGAFSTFTPGCFDKLKKINLSDSSITDEDLAALLLSAPNLEDINLTGCENIAGGLVWLEPESLKNLKTINMNRSNLIGFEIDYLLKAAPNLTEYSLFLLNEQFKKIGEITTNTETPPLKYDSYSPLISSPNAYSPSSSCLINGSTILDADTTLDPDLVININRIFIPLNNRDKTPPPNYYRLEVFNVFEINQNTCSLRNAFIMKSEGNPQLKQCEINRSMQDVFMAGKELKKQADHQYFYGKRELKLNAEWLGIPSLAAGETMLQYHTYPDDAAVEIQYSDRDNLYYIKSLAGWQNITLDFLLLIPHQENRLPKNIQRMVDDFNINYHPGDPPVNLANMTGHDYLAHIRKHKIGACRHRAFDFADRMKSEAQDIPVRIIHNDCHAFVEVMINEQWLRCDLGGYPAKLEIQELQAQKPVAVNKPVSVNKKVSVNKPISVNKKVSQESLPDKKSNVIIHNQHSSKYDDLLRHAEKKNPDKFSLKSFMQEILQPGENKKHLIELESSSEVTAMVLNLQKHCQTIQRPFIYIHSPEDVSCATHHLKREGSTGKILKGRGGLLHDFLQHDKYTVDNPPVLIVNYANFNADDIVRFNTLIDKERSVDTTPLPPMAIVIGVMNVNKPDCYLESDFTSRFDNRITKPVPAESLNETLGKLPVNENLEARHPETITINLYHASDWKSRLLGSWVLDCGNLVFQEGVLPAALKISKHIEIQNGSWDDPEFVFFWQQACLTGMIQHDEEILDTTGMTIHRSESYDWSTLRDSCIIQQKAITPDVLLNTCNLGDYFSRYECKSTEMIRLNGLIEEAANANSKLLAVHLTRTLSEDQWAMLLTECQQRQIKLEVHCAAGVALPNVLKHPSLATQEEVQAPDLHGAADTSTQVIYSTDTDTTVAMLTRAHPQYVVIDISECKPADLLVYMHPAFNEASWQFEFTQHERALLKALRKGKSIILKGRFSVELADALAPLLFERQQQLSNGKLVLISEEKKLLGYFPDSRVHDVTKEEKQFFAANETDELNWNEPLNTLKARLQFPDGWNGLSHLADSIKSLAEFNPACSEEEARQFNHARKKMVFDVLDKSPYVYIAGLSGVGKSTFVEKDLLKEITHEIYHTENRIEDWAGDKSSKLKLLFLDEANLSKREWSEFEGLFNTPPTILLNGKLHTLDANHKVIFAGNPLSYGDERTLAPFFARNGRAVVFSPLPMAVIYEQVLKPVFAGNQHARKAADICKPILSVYKYLCEQSTTEVLITPRELQMMILLTLSYCEKMPGVNPEMVARHYAHELARSLVPADALSAFDIQFGLNKNSIPALPLPQMQKNSAFTMTASRKPAASRLNEFLMLRAARRKNGNANDEQRYGGLGGIILEGEPGIGKSELVMAELRAHQFKPASEARATDDNIYYRMPVSMSTAERKILLLKAFKEGAVVVVDEMNSATLMEDLLNDALMGKGPDKSHPEKPGFMIIGTQNPVTRAGRRRASPALSRRLCTITLPAYPRDEMLAILIGDKILPAKITRELESLVEAYARSVAQAEKNCCPAPTFREVERIARKIKKHIPGNEIALDCTIATNVFQKDEHSYSNLPSNDNLLHNVDLLFNDDLPENDDPSDSSTNNAGFFKKHPLARDLLMGFAIGIVIAVLTLLIATGPIGITLGSIALVGGSLAGTLAMSAGIIASSSLLAGFIGEMVRYIFNEPAIPQDAQAAVIPHHDPLHTQTSSTHANLQTSMPPRELNIQKVDEEDCISKKTGSSGPRKQNDKHYNKSSGHKNTHFKPSRKRTIDTQLSTSNYTNEI